MAATMRPLISAIRGSSPSVACSGLIEIEPIPRDQSEHRRGEHWLGQRGDVEHRVSGHRLTTDPGLAGRIHVAELTSSAKTLAGRRRRVAFGRGARGAPATTYHLFKSTFCARLGPSGHRYDRSSEVGGP
jgi:hypothetical protein